MKDNSNFSQDYLLIDKFKNKKGNDTTECKEFNGKLIIKQFSGVNTENFIIKKVDGYKLAFSFFKLNGIHYVTINGKHVFDYKKFTKIQHISVVENNPDHNGIQIKNLYFGTFFIDNCDIEIFKKALDIMHKYIKTHKSFFNDFLYVFFN